MESSEVFDHMAPKLRGKKEGTFAYITVRDRWPKIVTKLVDQLTCNREKIVEKYGPEAEDDVRAVLEKFSRLRYRIMTDKALDNLHDNAEDVGEWNELLESNRTREIAQPNDVEELTWFGGPWLFVECFLYRYLFGAFYASNKLRHFDYFQDTKQTNFNDHVSQIEESAAFLLKISAEDAPVHELFGINTILKMSLWGNRADMSLTGGDNNVLKMSAMSASSKLSEFVLIDDVNELILKVLGPLYERRTSSESTPTTRRIDVVLDNAGVELVGDLIMAEFFLSRHFADRVVLHGKSFPWFVSDVTSGDFQWTLDQLANGQGEESRKFGERLKRRVERGELVFEAHRFWTMPYAYYKMEKVAEDLYKEMSSSSLAIFKGDLNYRKLVGDRDWDLDTSFEKACRGFAPCPFMALRTLKAETVAGLSKTTIDEILVKYEDDNSWMTSGEYAVCQLGGL